MENHSWNTAKVDVIIPVYRPDAGFKEVLKRLASQTLPVNRLILMVTGQELPEEEEYRRIWGKEEALEIHCLDPAQFDHGGTRKSAIGFSKAEICVCMTQDALPYNNTLLEQLVRPFYEETENVCLAASYARQLPAPDCRLMERYTRQFNYPETSRIKTIKDLPELGIKTFFCSNVCAAYRREIFDALGGFESRTIFNEDMIYAGHAVKAGYGICYAPNAQVIHSHNYSGAMQFHRNFDLAVSQKQHPEVFEGIPSEKEGKKLVKSTAFWLCRQGKPWLVFSLIYISGCKYLGYRMGKKYDTLPRWLLMKCTWNKRYWEK